MVIAKHLAEYRRVSKTGHIGTTSKYMYVCDDCLEKLRGLKDRFVIVHVTSLPRKMRRQKGEVARCGNGGCPGLMVPVPAPAPPETP